MIRSAAASQSLAASPSRCPVIMLKRSWPSRAWYSSLHAVFRLLGIAVWRVRCHGRHHVPCEGGAILLANHQSNLDPILFGLACDRRLNFLARKTLFGFAPFRLLIQSLDAIPIDREGLGIAGLKETLRRLKHAELVLIFPEGTRTRDGELAPLKPGFSALARRARVPLVPMAVEGAFAAWPRWQWLPRPTAIEVSFGPPIMPAEVAGYDERQLVDEVARRMQRCLSDARRRRARRVGPWPDLPVLAAGAEVKSSSDRLRPRLYFERISGPLTRK